MTFSPLLSGLSDVTWGKMLEVVKDENGRRCAGGTAYFDEESYMWSSPRGLRHWINSLVILTSMLNFAGAHYTPQWAVHIEGGQEVADRIAAKHGFVNLGKVRIFQNVFVNCSGSKKKEKKCNHSKYLITFIWNSIEPLTYNEISSELTVVLARIKNVSYTS